jgi:predicted unusual protein kinase regulating ubiquinone biosynthesis (AarF/ABC1/UbiB family)
MNLSFFIYLASFASASLCLSGELARAKTLEVRGVERTYADREEFYRTRHVFRGPEVEGLQAILNRLAMQNDPKFEIVFVDTDDRIAEIHRRPSGNTIYISRGRINLAQTEDDLAAVIAHEMSHTEEATRSRLQTELHSMRTESRVADQGGMLRMQRAGYDPRAMRNVWARDARDTGARSTLSAATSTHPDDGIRLTEVDRWLTENEARYRYAAPRELSPTLFRLRNSSAQGWDPSMRRPRIDAGRPVSSDAGGGRMASAARNLGAELSMAQVNARLLLWSTEDVERAFQSDPRFLALDEAGRLRARMRLHSDWQGFLAAAVHYTALSSDTRAATDRVVENMFADRSLGQVDDLLRADPGINIFDLKVPFSSVESLRVLARDIRASGLAEVESAFREMMRKDSQGRPYLALDTFERGRVLTGLGLPERMSLVEVQGRTNLGSPERAFYLIEIIEHPSSNAEMLGALHELAKSRPFHNLSQWPRYAERFRASWPRIRDAAIAARDLRFLSGLVIDPLSSSEKRTVGAEELDKLSKQWVTEVMTSSRLSVREKLAIIMVNASFHEPYRGSIPEFARELRNFEDLLELQRTAMEISGDRGNSTVFLEILETRPEWRVTPAQVADLIGRSRPGEIWNHGMMGQMGGLLADAREQPGPAARTYLNSRNYSQATFDHFNTRTRRSRDLDEIWKYNLNHSERMQRALVERMHPAWDSLSALERHRLWMGLTSRGATGFTDGLAERLYLANGFSCSECVDEVLTQGRLFDFELRRRLFAPRIAEITTRITAMPLVDRDARMRAVIDGAGAILDAFPEDSLERADLLENFARGIRANQAEAHVIELLKGRASQGGEAVAFRAFSGLMGRLSQITPEERWEFILYLRGNGPVPSSLRDEIEKTIGGERLQRLFRNLTPNLRAVLLNPILTPPHGLLGDPAMRERITTSLVEGVPGNLRPRARLLLDASVYSLQQAAPYQESLFLSYLVGQASDANVHPAIRMRNMLTAQGSTGIALGQQLFQRRMVPDDWLPYFAELTENARRPSLNSIYELTARHLGIENLDEVLEVRQVMGDASTKVVLRVRYVDGRVRDFDENALKLLWENLDRQLDVEENKLRYFVDYLEREGGPEYRRLRSVVGAVQRRLRTQVDIGRERENFARMAALYNGENDGVRFQVVRPDPLAGDGPFHSHEEIGPGRGLSELNETERTRVYRAILNREADILLSETTPDGNIYFEADRHRGNFRVDFSKDPPLVSIIDYPLLQSIERGSRDAMIELLALIEGTRTRSEGILLTQVERRMGELLHTLVGADQSPRELRRLVAAYSAEPKRGLVPTILDIFAALEREGKAVPDSVYDYLTALGNAEHYASQLPLEGGRNAFARRVADRAQALAERSLANVRVGVVDYCRIGFSRIFGRRN